MKYSDLRDKVPSPKGSLQHKGTTYTDYGDFAVCISSSGKPFIVDSDIAEDICHRSWCDSEGYLASRVGNELIRLHDYVMATVVDEKPNGYFIDHVNQDRYDDRRNNLRLVAPTENSKNIPLRKRNKSGYVGVCRSENGKRYRAYITVDGKQMNLGRYDTPEEAWAARLEAEERLGFLTRPHSHKHTIKDLCEIKGEKEGER